jgi:hypothetical protein
MGAFTEWLRQPFSLDMNAWHWFAFYGLIIVIAIGWKFILRAYEDL